MKRLLSVYFACFATSVALFALYSWLALGTANAGWALSFWRLLLFASGGACAVVTWGAAIWVAAVHRTIWPLALAVLTVCATMASIVLR